MRTPGNTGWAFAGIVLLCLCGPAVHRAKGAEGPPAQPAPPAQPTPPAPDGSFLSDLNGAKRVIFVVDFSGSMHGRIASVRKEVAAAVETLKPSVSFDVIAFDRDAKVWRDEPVPADAAHKREADDFLDDTATSDIDSRGTFTDPWPAMRAALRLEPDRICLVTDGDFPREDDFAARVSRALGPKPAVRIDTLAWVQSPANLKPFASLRLISHRTAGRFLCVTEQGPDDPYFHQFEERDLPKAVAADQAPATG